MSSQTFHPKVCVLFPQGLCPHKPLLSTPLSVLKGVTLRVSKKDFLPKVCVLTNLSPQGLYPLPPRFVSSQTFIIQPSQRPLRSDAEGKQKGFLYDLLTKYQ